MATPGRYFPADVVVSDRRPALETTLAKAEGFPHGGLLTDRSMRVRGRWAREHLGRGGDCVEVLDLGSGPGTAHRARHPRQQARQVIGTYGDATFPAWSARRLNRPGDRAHGPAREGRPPRGPALRGGHHRVDQPRCMPDASPMTGSRCSPNPPAVHIVGGGGRGETGRHRGGRPHGMTVKRR
ncbi:hypothetical protein SAFG77S_08177 [Streptomyces afghaniensis]